MSQYKEELLKKVNTVKSRHKNWVNQLDAVDLGVALALPETDALRLDIVRALHANKNMQTKAHEKVVKYTEDEERVPVHIPIGRGASTVVWLPRDLA